MNLGKIIKSKLKILYREYNKIKKKSSFSTEINNDINSLEKFLNDINNNVNSLLNYSDEDIKKYLEFIYKDQDDLEGLLEDIRLIKIVLKGKYEKKLSIDLSSSQLKVINVLCNKIYKYIHKYKEKRENSLKYIEENKDILNELELDILELEELESKVRDKSNKEELTEEDFLLFNRMILEDENVTFIERRNALLAFKDYNDSIINHIENEVDVEKINKLVSIFKEYGINENIEKCIKKHELEISNNIDLDNVIEILEYFKSVFIIKRFEVSTLLGICLDGTKESVENTFNKINSLGIRSKMLYETSGIWIDNLPKDIKKRKKHYSKGKEKNIGYSSINHEISFDELLENEEFLTNLGYDVSIENEKSAKTLKTPNYRIRENYELLKLYGILDNTEPDKFSTSAFAFSNIDDKCDKFIELGLLNGDTRKYPNSNYIGKYPSAISFLKNEVYMLLYKLKKDKTLEEYYDTIFSEYVEGRLSPKFYKDKLNYKLNTDIEIEEFKSDNFIEQSDYINNSNVYEEAILSNMPINYSDSVLEIPEVKYMEENYKESKYIYRIGETIISRLKVLRCLTALKTLVKIDKDSIMYSVVRGMYLSEEAFKDIANVIGYNYKGVLDNGILKKI